MTDPFDTTGIEKERELRQREAKNQRDTEAGDIKWMMGNKRGRRILWRFLEGAGVYRSTFNTDPLLMAFAEGNRNYGLRLLALIQAGSAENYTLMIKENTDDDGKHQQPDTRQRGGQ